MVELQLHGVPIHTVFDLLGKRENDITYSFGWALSRSDRLTRALLHSILPGTSGLGATEVVRLQEFVPGGGYTDVEIVTEQAAVIIEAKRGWSLPTAEQLRLYAPRLRGFPQRRLVVVSECSPDYAMGRIPTKAGGVPVVYLSWKQISVLVGQTAREGGHAEKRLLREFDRYIRGLMTMQNQMSNRVYVVALGSSPTSWSGSLTPIEIVTQKDKYFHEVGGGYPKEPPNYVGFRWNGKLQEIRHVDHYDVITDPHPHIPEIPTQQWNPSYLYRLGPPIRPTKDVRTGKLFRAQRVWAAIDLLLTCDTIAEARDETQERDRTAGL